MSDVPTEPAGSGTGCGLGHGGLEGFGIERAPGALPSHLDFPLQSPS